MAPKTQTHRIFVPNQKTEDNLPDGKARFARKPHRPHSLGSPLSPQSVPAEGRALWEHTGRSAPPTPPPPTQSSVPGPPGSVKSPRDADRPVPLPGAVRASPVTGEGGYKTGEGGEETPPARPAVPIASGQPGQLALPPLPRVT